MRYTDGYDQYGRAHYRVDVAVPRGRDPRRHDDQASEPYLATASAVSYTTRDDDLRYICNRTVATARYEIALITIVSALGSWRLLEFLNPEPRRTRERDGSPSPPAYMGWHPHQEDEHRIVRNEARSGVINRFGTPCPEKYGKRTIGR